MMKRFVGTLFAAILLGMSVGAGSARGSDILTQLGILDLDANGGINPATGLAWAAGDTYRFAFSSSIGTNATSTDIADYNAFIQGLANASGLGIGAAEGVTWKAIASTLTVAANVNTSTDSGTGESIWLLNGTSLVADNYADLYGFTTHSTAINKSETFGSPYDGGDYTSVWTGSDGVGGIKGGGELGDPDGTSQTGLFGFTSNDHWINRFSIDNTLIKGVYGLSEPLSIQGLLTLSTLAASDILTTAATLNGNLKAPTTNLSVSVYWGTSDGGTTQSSWSNTAFVGSWTNVSSTNISHAVSSLDSGTVYYYTFSGSNATTNVWADTTVNFGTVGVPSIVNDGYTPLNGYATLQGDLLSTGGAPTTVRMYWGDTDGGTDASAWANTNILSGTPSAGAVSSDTSAGLTYGVQFYFRSHASNVNGSVWAPASSGFVTGLPSPAPPTANLEAWYDASVGVTPASGTVTGWADQSGNGRDLESYQGSPTVAANEINGLTAIEFNADNENLQQVSPVNEYFAKETWLAFRSGQNNTFRGWGAPFGAYQTGDGNDRAWMFENNRAKFWNAELPASANHNGTDISSANNFDMSGQGSMSDFMVLRVVSGPNSGTQIRPYVVGTRSYQWSAGRYYTAEILAYNAENSAADRDAIGGYLSAKYGITTTWLDWVSVANLPVSPDFTDTSATFNGTFRGLESVFDVYVYWGTSDGGSDASAWGNTNFLGSFSDADTTSLSFTTNTLTAGTEYFYAFCVQNPATNMWAEPSQTFQTIGSPAVHNASGVTGIGIGSATLNGALSAGGTADVYICWGYVNAGTNSGTAAWQNVASVGSAYLQEPFSTPISGALYGIPYYYSCFVTNAFGGAWSPVVSFLTDQVIPAPAIANTGPTGLVPGEAELNGTLTAAQSVYDVWVYWSTNNGAMSKSAWLADSGEVQYMGSFTNEASINLQHPLTGLPSLTTYYYNFYASNVVDETWGDSFVFGSAGPPTVENRGVTDIGPAAATLRGELTEGGEANIYVCWGTSDAGTGSPAAWDHVDVMGPYGVAVIVSNAVTDAFYGITYYYRCFATNSLGTDWSDTVVSFTTAQPEGLVTDLPNPASLQVWYDASYGITEGGGNVTGWSDRSTNTRHLVSGAGTPKRLPNTLNGRPVVQFNSNGEQLNMDDPSDEYFALETYLVFRSSYSATQFGPSWGSPYGAAGPDNNDRTWMLWDRNDRFWNSEPPAAVTHNGNTVASANNFEIGADVSEYMVLKVITGSGSGTQDRSYTLGRMDEWANSAVDTAEIIAYNTNLSAGEEDELGGYLAWKYGITTTYPAFTPPNGSTIVNALVSGVAPGQAQLNATLDSADAIYHVRAYWSTNDYGTNAAAWLADGAGAYVGVFTNVITGVSHVASGLASATDYYYTFRGTNDSAEIWGEPSMTFGSAGPPSVGNDGGATAIGIGTATLRGDITGGGGADVYICWGETDGGTNGGTAAWQFVASLGGQVQAVPFSNVVSGLYYGIGYDYRVFASNALGTAWSEADTFSSLAPVPYSGVPVTDGLELWLDASQITGLSDGQTVMPWEDQSGNAHDTTSTASDPAYYASAADLNNKPVVRLDGGNDGFGLGDLSASFPSAATLFVAVDINNDTAYNLFDTRDNDPWWRYNGSGNSYIGVFRNGRINNTPSMPSDGQHIFEVESSASAYKLHQNGSETLSASGNYHSGNTYQIATMRGRYLNGDMPEIIAYNRTLTVDERNEVGAYLAYKYGITSAYTGYEPPVTFELQNTAAAYITDSSADMAGTLEATGSVFTVTAYWSTNNNADAAAWQADGSASSVLIGSFTNVVGQAVAGPATGLTRGETYFYTLEASNVSTSLWATPNVSFTTDGTAPNPDPMTFAVEPAAQSTTSAAMTASIALDALNNPAEYYFENTTNTDNSGWISSRVWLNTGLTEGTMYGYRVKARDAVSNETAYSAIFTATPAGDVLPPNPSPLTWASVPAAILDNTIVMTATTATDPNAPVEYYFENTNDLSNSGWITSPSWTDTGLTQGTTYGYRVRAQDSVGNKTGWSTIESALAEAPEITIFLGTFEDPAAVTSATDGTDPTGWADVSPTGNRAGLGDLSATGYSNYDGAQAAWLNVYNAVPVMETTSSVLDTNLVVTRRYVLSYKAASSGAYTVYADLFAGTNVIMTVQRAVNGSDFNSQTASGTLVVSAGDTGIGEALKIRLRVTGGAWNQHCYVDSLRLTMTDISGDSVAPNPDPMTWTQQPVQSASTSVVMVASLATDPAFVEYLFTNTVNGAVSGWQDSRLWLDTGLTDGVTYTYRVKARDKSVSQNETAWSAPVNVAVDEDRLFYSSFEWPLVAGATSITDPDGWSNVSPSGNRAGLGNLSASSYSNYDGNQAAWLNVYNTVPELETTSVVLDAPLEGFTQYTLTFDAASDTTSYTIYADLYADTNLLMTAWVQPNNSRNFALYQGSNTWTSPGSSPFNGETLKIKLRVTGGAWNTQSYADNLLLTKTGTGGDSTAPTPDPMSWVQLPTPAVNASVFMMATNATDPSLVEYLFTNTVNGNVSGWQDERIWIDTGLTDGVSYTYRVKARDKSAGQNETGWSSAESATADDTIVLYESFEDLVVSGRTSTMSPGWFGSDTRTGLWNEDSVTMTTPSGEQCMYVWNSRYVQSTGGLLSDVLTAGTTYTLTFDAASELGNGNIDYDVELLAGSTILASANGGPMGTSNMGDYSDTIVFTPGSSHPNLGDTLAIKLRYITGDWHWVMGYDNVKLKAQPDETAPSPNPVGFAMAPFGINGTTIVMASSNATDATGPVEYLLTNATSGVTSGWSTNTFWSNTGLTAGNSYDYQVRARDFVGNETAWSAVSSATAEKENDPPTPDPMTFAVAPVSVNPTTVAMTATTATDVWNNPTEYYFVNTTNGNNSGWISGTTWTNSGLTTGVMYGYQVKARDAVSNETAYSVEAFATPAPDTTPPNPDPMSFAVAPAAVTATSISMTASTASDFSAPVAYYFHNTTNGNNSGWQAGTGWTDTSLTPGTLYGYQVKARDAVSNETAYSSIATAEAIAPPVTIFLEDFENPPHDDVTGFAINQQDSQGWVRSGTAGLLDEDSGFFGTFDGSQAGAMDDSGTYTTTSNNLAAVLQASVMYDLTFNVASENGGSVTYQVELLAGSTVLNRIRSTVASTNMSGTTGSINFTAAPNSASLGQTLVIRLTHPNAGGNANEAHVYYDNVRLTTTDTSGDSTAPTPAPLTWVVTPEAVMDNGLTMVASEVSDPRWVQYYFSNTVNGAVSGWQDAFWWNETGLSGGTFSYVVKARDNSANLNETGWSSSANGTVDPYIIFSEGFEDPVVYRAAGMSAAGWLGNGTQKNEDGGLFTTPYGNQVGDPSYLGSAARKIETTALSDVLELDYTYTLTFNVGNVNVDNGAPRSDNRYVAELIAGSTVVATSTALTSTDDLSETGGFVFLADGVQPNLGEALSLKFYMSAGDYHAHPLIDNVKLRAVRPPRTLFMFR
jgi:hypothetical protein